MADGGREMLVMAQVVMVAGDVCWWKRVVGRGRTLVVGC